MKKLFGLTLATVSAISLSSCGSNVGSVKEYAEYQYDVTNYVPASMKDEVGNYSNNVSSNSLSRLEETIKLEILEPEDKSKPSLIYGDINKDDLTSETSESISKLLYGAADIQAIYDEYTSYVDNVKTLVSENGDTYEGDWGSVKLTSNNLFVEFQFSDINYGIYSYDLKLHYSGTGEDTEFYGIIEGKTLGKTVYKVNFGFDKTFSYSYIEAGFENANVFFGREYTSKADGNEMSEVFLSSAGGVDLVQYKLAAKGDDDGVGVRAKIDLPSIDITGTEVYNKDAELVFESYSGAFGGFDFSETRYNLIFANGWKSAQTGLTDTTNNGDEESDKESGTLTLDDDTTIDVDFFRAKTFDAAKDTTDDNNFNPVADRKILMSRKTRSESINKNNIGFAIDGLTYLYDADFLYSNYSKGVDVYGQAEIKDKKLSDIDSQFIQNILK